LLDGIIEQYQPEVLVLEKIYAHAKHPATAGKMGHVRGVICLLCASRQVKLVEHSVKRIRIALLGNGGATKLQTRSIVAQILKVDENKLTLDASDALALALGYISIERRSLK
jgi:crossover junction endodeoxyribonuclease RuvC